MTELYGVADVCLGIHREFSEDYESEWGDSVDDAVDAMSEEDLKPLMEGYKKHAQALDRRFRVREMLISMFSNGVFTNQSDWKLLDTLTFRGISGGPADLFVWQAEDGGTVTILTLTGVDDPASIYSNIQELCSHIVNHTDIVGQKMADRQGEHGSDQPLRIAGDYVEGAIVVSNFSVTDAVEAFDQSSGDSRVSIWEFDGADGEEISVISDVSVDDWSWHVPDNRLGNLLTDGQRFANQYQVSIDRFYDSHHELLFRELPVYLHMTHDRSKKRWYCSETELVDFLAQSWSSPPREAVRPRAQDLIEWWLHIGAFEKRYERDDYYDEEEPIYTFANYNGHKKDPTDIWEDLVKPYRMGVASAILRAYEESGHFDPETPLMTLVENARDTINESDQVNAV